MEQYEVVILGAGAAGLMCAATAARRGRTVLVLERANKIGKKILMSGGGRCNFTNYSVEPENYISANKHFCISALNRYTQWDFIALVQKYNIVTEERRHGQLFCVGSAKEILALLKSECDEVGVEIRESCEVGTIKCSASGSDDIDVSSEHPYTLSVNGFSDASQQTKITCNSLVVATGALSIPSLGGSGIGYEIASQFEIALTQRRAGLVPLMFSSATKMMCERLSGLALDVEVSCNEYSFRENILFTHRGMSGPVILQISNYWYPGDSISINLLPEIDAVDWLIKAKSDNGKSRLNTLLNKVLAKSLVLEIQKLWWPKLGYEPLAQWSDQQLKEIGCQLNNWQLKPSASEGYRTAEVTLGGVDTGAISSKTMEAKQQKGLYFIGEVLDVSGHLGGFNFQWAWSSGYAAGSFA
ncbi:MAG: NAD(P)/FAD-dependent oxidoreductase [Pseudomonadales bacterium]|nr:NAD(P)/FAD-dependent oxidoreductase [Pseudomonadales bacterium]